MTVRDLIETLSQFDPDLEVIAGSDEEGNDYVIPYMPKVLDCVEDNDTYCGYRPLHSDEVAEHLEDGCVVVKMVVM